MSCLPVHGGDLGLSAGTGTLTDNGGEGDQGSSRNRHRGSQSCVQSRRITVSSRSSSYSSDRDGTVEIGGDGDNSNVNGADGDGNRGLGDNSNVNGAGGNGNRRLGGRSRSRG